MAHSCCAVETAYARVDCRTSIKKKLQVFNKVHAEEETVSADRFEHPTLVQQVLKRSFVSSVQLFRGQEHKQLLLAAVRIYIADPCSSYNFIYQCLYPKHVFW